TGDGTRSAQRPSRSLRAIGRTGEQGADLLVARLREVLVPQAYSVERLRRVHAHDVVDVVSELVTGSSCSDGNGDDDVRGMLLADRHRGRPHRGTGREAVVYEDHGLAFEARWVAIAAVGVLAPLELTQLRVQHALDRLTADPEAPHQALVEHEGAAACDRSHCEPRVSRHSNLAHDEDIAR